MAVPSNDGSESTTDEVGAPAPASPGMELTPDIEGQDPDALALAAAEAALKAEATTEQGSEQQDQVRQPAAPRTEPKADDPPAAAPKADNSGTMIPKARFDEATGKLREQLAYMQGQLDQMSRASTPNGQPAPQAEKPIDPIEQRVNELKGLIIDAESRFDAAEISSAEKAAIVADITAQMAETIAGRIVDERARNNGSIVDEEIEQRHAAKLESDHPYLLVISDEQMRDLSRRAHAMAKLDGKPFKGGKADDLRLRQQIAELSDFYGPRWYPDASVERQPTPQPSTATTPAKPPLSSKASAAAAKVDLANRMPPDIRNLGTSVNGQSPINEAAIAGMSDVDIENLPQRERDRILQGA